MNDSKEIYVAIDIGGTHARVASFLSLINPKFENVKVFELSHVFENDYEIIIKFIRETAKQGIIAIGVSLPGTVNEQKSALISAPNLTEWINVDIKDKLSKEFNCEIYLDNDAVASALGEVFYGNSNNEDFVFMIWGTGMGGALLKFEPKLEAKKLQREDYLYELKQQTQSGPLLKKYGRPLSELNDEEWNDIISDFSKIIVYTLNKLNIKNIIVGGGVVLKQKQRIIALSKKLKKDFDINLQITKLGDNHTFCLYGAAALIKVKTD